MGASRRHRRRNSRALLFRPTIPDDGPTEAKNALALRRDANVTGRCFSCGATFRTVWLAPKIGQAVMEHESWCEAQTDPPGYTEAVTAELRRQAGEAGA